MHKKSYHKLLFTIPFVAQTMPVVQHLKAPHVLLASLNPKVPNLVPKSYPKSTAKLPSMKSPFGAVCTYPEGLKVLKVLQKYKEQRHTDAWCTNLQHNFSHGTTTDTHHRPLLTDTHQYAETHRHSSICQHSSQQ